MKVGILGGTFDPIHIGHIELAKGAMLQYGLDEVHLMTGGKPPHKRDREITDPTVRYEMTRLALEGEMGLVADDYEVKKTDYTYTAKTLTELKKIHGDWDIYFIIGEDSLRDLPKWYEPHTVAANCVLLVYPRGDGEAVKELAKLRAEELGADIRIIDLPQVDVSSTEIRRRVRESKPLDGLVPDRVAEFIREKRLYRT